MVRGRDKGKRGESNKAPVIRPVLEPKDTIHLAPRGQELISRKSTPRRSRAVSWEGDGVQADPAGLAEAVGLAKSRRLWGPVSSGVRYTATGFS